MKKKYKRLDMVGNKNPARKPDFKEKVRKTRKKNGTTPKMNKNPNWKGGILKHFGYILIRQPHHPFCQKSGYIAEHKLVMEKYIKRFVIPGEIVHHINGKRDDNRIKNLQLLSNKGEHNTIHHKGKKIKRERNKYGRYK